MEGITRKIDAKQKVVKVDFDKETEEQKIHDPFFGALCLASGKKENSKQYYSDSSIEE